MNHKRHNFISYLLFSLAIMLLLVGSIKGKGVEAEYPGRLVETQATGQALGGLLRFHVLANSDEKEDQELKNEVKDILVNYLKRILVEVDSLAEAKEVIAAEMANIEKIAENEIRDRGYSYQVVGEIGVYSFPTRMYGNAIFPAGEYEAVRIIIGQGQGENWWCVLFPALCFIEGTSMVTDTSPRLQATQVSGNIQGEDLDKTGQLANNRTTSKMNSVAEVQLKFKLTEMISAILNSFRNR
jgi:stage II sporulation protein R